MKSNEDDIVRFYACKIIENILAQSVTIGIRFTTAEIVNNLYNVYISTKNEGMKTCAAICISHIARINTDLVSFIFDKFTLKHFCSVFQDGNQKLQQV